MTESVAVPASSEGASQRQHSYVRRYAEQAADIPDIQHVFYDNGGVDLDLFVVYAGDRWHVRPQLHDIEERLHARYPGVLVDMRYVPQDNADINGLRRTYTEAYSR